jgi:S-DNA-T family DNA segregation ATPase FtsK/SpoIIIE
MTITGGHSHQDDEGGGELLHFPASDRHPGEDLELVDASDVEHVGPVYEAEIVDDPPPTTRVAKVMRSGARVATTVRHSERTITSVKFAVRQGTYLLAGTRIITARLWDAKTNARPERLMRAAEAAGDWDHLGEWHDRGEKMRDSRHKRHMDFLELPLRAAKAFGISVLALHVLLLFLGFALWINGSVANMLVPMLGMYAGIAWTAHALGVAWSIGWRVGLFVLVIGVWSVGKKHAEPGQWMRPSATPGNDRDIVPDEGAILGALRDLNLAPLNRKIKEGWLPRWVMPTVRDGNGWRTQLELPGSVNVGMIVDKKEILAHNLVRLPVEVWPTEPRTQPGVLDLWVADQGILTGPVAPWPLLTSGGADFFKGVPVGIDQRGDETTGKLMACNYAIAGIMGSGKTSLVIELMLGAMLDPIVELDVYAMAFNADFDPMEPRLRVLVKGDEDEEVGAAIDALRALRSAVSERGKALSDLGGDETKVTRELAEKYPELRPRLTVFDECQELFRHEKWGEEAKQLAIKVMMKSRKCALPLIWVTPAPSADSLPRDLAKTVSHRVCFAIGDHQGNDAILGTGAHRQGITATTLVPGEDIGTAMASGFATRPGLLRTHHIRKDASVDEITPVVKRALARREQRGIGPALTVTEGGARDLLADVADVIGNQTVPAADVPALLARNFPSQVLYRQMTGKQLRQLLKDEHGVRVPSTGNRWPVSPRLVTEALHERRQLSDGQP